MSSPSKGSADLESDIMKSLYNQNSFLINTQQNIDRLILMCWEGNRLKDEDKNAVSQFRIHYKYIVPKYDKT